jgi:hypothetical protein
LNAAKTVCFAAPRPLKDEERRLILDDEERAWKLGREVLAELGFEDFERYDLETRKALDNYRIRFERIGLLYDYPSLRRLATAANADWQSVAEYIKGPRMPGETTDRIENAFREYGLVRLVRTE